DEDEDQVDAAVARAHRRAEAEAAEDALDNETGLSDAYATVARAQAHRGVLDGTGLALDGKGEVVRAAYLMVDEEADGDEAADGADGGDGDGLATVSRPKRKRQKKAADGERTRCTLVPKGRARSAKPAPGGIRALLGQDDESQQMRTGMAFALRPSLR
ncbi:hypothetical protein T492DRAFT_885291, partial [Pavlovales sp. CCMP2436]